MMSSSPLGSGGCANARGTASQFVPSGVWRSLTSAWLHTSGPIQSPEVGVCVCVLGRERGKKRAEEEER